MGNIIRNIDGINLDDGGFIQEDEYILNILLALGGSKDDIPSKITGSGFNLRQNGNVLGEQDYR